MNSGRITLPETDRSLSWSVAQKSKVAGRASGDGYFICHNNRVVMFAVSDGSGSGAEAEEATNICLNALGKKDIFDIKAEFLTCHKVLKGSRGVALALVSIDLFKGTLQWAAIGDIDGILIRSERDAASETLIQRGGVLGLSQPTIHEQTHNFEDRDLIVLTSDGVKREYRNQIRADTSPENAASSTMRKFARESDDSIVLAVSMGSAS